MSRLKSPLVIRAPRLTFRFGVYRTEVNTLSRVTSEFGFWPVSHRIEAFGLSKLPRSIEGVRAALLDLSDILATNQNAMLTVCSPRNRHAQARLGLQLVADLILRPSTSAAFLSSGPLEPYHFDPVPSAFSLRIRARLDEARTKWTEVEHGLTAEEAEQREIDRSEVAESRRRGWRVAGDRAASPEDMAGGEPVGLTAWRERWRSSYRRGKSRFRERVCAMTGLLCDAKDPAAVAGIDATSRPPVA